MKNISLELKREPAHIVLSSFLKIKKGKYAAIKGKKNISLRNLIFSATLNTLKTVKTTTATR